ncbi:tyrosinase family protein [Pseudomonas saponiphila]|uniref:tyrosinase family protein n=1 Tax=Pseudomonas saponiphila TaxID=556534 RepID=UPI00224068CB|nr:tyrosinase family protein [Pseudomonas saponiphila]
MVFIRRDVGKLSGDWDPTLLWYARAVGVLRQRPITDRTSWRFLAGIHGFSEFWWKRDGYLKADERLPKESERLLYWDQCQHSNWFFLPWHRGYLASFEQIVRDEVVRLGGPQDWALPYWNYNEGSQSLNLPPAFAAKVLPDNEGPNPLYVENRFGISGNGEVVLNADLIKLDCLDEPRYEGGKHGTPPGFGGTPKSLYRGGVTGRLESCPHNVVHTEVGGPKQVRIADDGSRYEVRGLMSYPETAALDPIFWLHHANIDRLWQVWLDSPDEHSNPDKSHWYNGPDKLSRPFIVPQVNGEPWKFKVVEVLDTLAPRLNYRYDNTAPVKSQGNRLHQRLQRLGLAAGQLQNFSVSGALMVKEPETEVIGANQAPLDIVGHSVQTSVQLDKQGAQQVFNSLKSNVLAASLTPPDRVFLNLENIRGNNDAVLLEVYVNLPADADPTQHPELRAGVLSLFGVSSASRADQEHGGHGITEVFEITDIIDALHLGGITSADQLNVRLVSRAAVPAEDQITVARVSLTRLGG